MEIFFILLAFMGGVFCGVVLLAYSIAYTLEKRYAKGSKL